MHKETNAIGMKKIKKNKVTVRKEQRRKEEMQHELKVWE